MHKNITVLVLVLALLFTMSGFGFAEALYDFGGETVVFSHYWRLWDNFEDGAGRARLEEVEEMFNVNIELLDVHWSETAGLVRESVLSGDVPYDVGIWQSHWTIEWDLYDYLWDLNPILDQEFFDRFPQVGMVGADQQPMIGDRMYSVHLPEAPPMQKVYWNKEFFDREGLPTPYELMDEDQWNWENFRQIALDATIEDEQWGLGGLGLVGHGIGFPYTNDASPIITENGRLVYNGNSPEFVEAVEFWYDLQQSGAVYEELGLHQSMPEWLDGNLAMFIYYHSDQLPEVGDFGIAPLPKGPRADEYVVPATLVDCMVVPLTVDNPEMVMEVLMALLEISEPYIDTEEYADSYWYDYAEEEGFVDMESLEISRWMSELAVPDFSNYMTTSLGGVLVNEILTGEQSAQAALDAIASEEQSHLDDTFN